MMSANLGSIGHETVLLQARVIIKISVISIVVTENLTLLTKSQ